MAEFCSQCEPEYFDIDLVSIALDLERGQSETILCEGCSIRAIYKDESGHLFFAKAMNGEVNLENFSIENL